MDLAVLPMRLALLLPLALAACASQPPATVAVDEEPNPPVEAAMAVEEEPKPEAAVVDDRLVVHEWGTFTARSKEGQLQIWTRADRVEPLPSFVFENWMSAAKQEAKGTIRMETPVLYFYSAKAQTVDVQVEFPGGFLTEWYPHADLQDTVEKATLHWPAVDIVPGPDPDYPVAGESHYYAARATESTPLEVRGSDPTDPVEHEKLLFYRGVGSFEIPIQAEVRGRQVELRPSRTLAGVVVFRNEGEGGDGLGFEVIGTLEGPVTLDIPKLEGDPKALREAMHAELVAAGLFEAEASAMLETWQSLWFEPGLRILYLVPPERTAELLPLAIDPAPDELVRVMVGRLDLL